MDGWSFSPPPPCSCGLSDLAGGGDNPGTPPTDALHAVILEPRRPVVASREMGGGCPGCWAAGKWPGLASLSSSPAVLGTLVSFTKKDAGACWAPLEAAGLGKPDTSVNQYVTDETRLRHPHLNRNPTE